MTPLATTTDTDTYDVLVAGGGPAGVAAAVAAARSGARVALVERYGFLGGTMTAVTLGSLCGYYTVRDGAALPVVGSFATEVADRLRDCGGAPDKPVFWLRTASLPYDPFRLTLVLDELVGAAGVDVLLHSMVTGVLRDGDRVTGIEVHSKQGPRRLRAPVVVDCTGDADVVAQAGGEFLPVDGPPQFPSTMFRFGGVDTDRAATISRAELHAHLERAVAAGIDLPRTAGGMYSVHPGIMHLNITRVSDRGRPPDPARTEEFGAAEAEGRRQVLRYEQAFRGYVPGFEHAFVLDCGAQLGVRESRRVAGAYVLSSDDVTGAARFPDAIGCSAWPMERHGAGRGTQWGWLDPGAYYQIPLRVLVPRELDGVLVAGRCASADLGAQASLRVTAQCMAMGEAAGVLAHLATEGAQRPRDVPAERVRRVLTDRGAFLGTTADQQIHAEQIHAEPTRAGEHRTGGNRTEERDDQDA